MLGSICEVEGKKYILVKEEVSGYDRCSGCVASEHDYLCDALLDTYLCGNYDGIFKEYQEPEQPTEINSTSVSVQDLKSAKEDFEIKIYRYIQEQLTLFQETTGADISAVNVSMNDYEGKYKIDNVISTIDI